MRLSIQTAAVLCVAFAAASALAKSLNGFELEPASIPVGEIVSGGPPRDGILALVAPPLLPADSREWSDDEPVLALALGGEARAYPIAILDWHELVNDQLGGRPILVTYCPLCGTGIVFDRMVEGQRLMFGVSGLLYQSDVLLYDSQTESLWSQIAAKAVTGPSLGSRLRILRSSRVRWGDWKQRHPTSTIVSPQTGHARSYGRSPYRGYENARKLYFPVSYDRRYHPKMPTLGIRLPTGLTRAYPAEEVVRAGGRVAEEIAGYRIELEYHKESRSFDVKAPGEIEVIEGFWFAWNAFHPNSEIFEHEAPEESDGSGLGRIFRRPNWR